MEHAVHTIHFSVLAALPSGVIRLSEDETTPIAKDPTHANGEAHTLSHYLHVGHLIYYYLLFNPLIHTPLSPRLLLSSTP